MEHDDLTKKRRDLWVMSTQFGKTNQKKIGI